MNIAERGEYWARWQPEAIALKVGEDEFTWGELSARARACAGGLQARGIGPGDRVGILGGNSAEWCFVALGTLYAGAVVVPINLRLKAGEIAHVVDHSGCSLVAYDAAFAELYAGTGTAVPGVPLADAVAGPPVETPADRTGDDLAVIGYTSGTSGFPKGAMLTHANLRASATQWGLADDSFTTRRTLLPVPLAFTGGIVNNFLSTYIVGGTLILETDFVPDRMLRILVEERISFFAGVPIMWQAVAGADGFADADLSALTTAVCGGARVPRPLLEAFLAKDVVIRQAYAQTEATGSITLLPPAHAAAKLASAGVPNADTRLRLVGEDGADITAAGVVGEIVVRGPQVMAGYWEDADGTAQALRDGWLHTGDLGQYDADGFLEVVDRLKAMFISGGINVYPAEIERVIDALPDVAECCALGIADERFGEACALVVVGTDGPVDEEALLAHCAEHLADYKTPRTIIQVTEPLPRGMSGKILRPEIQARYGS